MTADAHEKEVVAEQPSGPAEIGMARAVRDRFAEVGRADDEADLLTEFARRGVAQRFALVDAAARRDPAVAPAGVRSVDQEPQEQGPPVPVDHQHPRGTAPVPVGPHDVPLATAAVHDAQISESAAPEPVEGRGERHTR